MRRSEFLRAADAEFGVRAPSLLEDLVLGALGGRTSARALADGVPPKEIWNALCDEADVPLERRHGVGRQEPRRR